MLKDFLCSSGIPCWCFFFFCLNSQTWGVLFKVSRLTGVFVIARRATCANVYSKLSALKRVSKALLCELSLTSSHSVFYNALTFRDVIECSRLWFIFMLKKKDLSFCAWHMCLRLHLSEGVFMFPVLEWANSPCSLSKQIDPNMS